MFVSLPFNDVNKLINSLQFLNREQIDNLEQALFVLKMEGESNPLLKKSYFEEFDEIYLGDILTENLEGDILSTVELEIDQLSNMSDNGSKERLFYLSSWVNTRFKDQ